MDNRNNGRTQSGECLMDIVISVAYYLRIQFGSFLNLVNVIACI